MGDEQRSSEQLDEFERQLMACRPLPARLDRARLLFLAGQESVRAARGGRRSRAVWCLSALSLALLGATIGLAVRLERGGQPRVIERIVYVERRADDGQPAKLDPTGQPGEVGPLMEPRDGADEIQSAMAAGSRGRSAEMPPEDPPALRRADAPPSPSTEPGASWDVVRDRVDRQPRLRDHYLRQRTIALTLGIEALATIQPGGGPSSEAARSYGELRSSLLGQQRGDWSSGSAPRGSFQ